MRERVTDILTRCEGRQRVVFAADNPSAIHKGFGGLRIEEREGPLRSLDTGTIAGGAMNFNEHAHNMVKVVAIPLPWAIQMVSLNPAEGLGLQAHKDKPGGGQGCRPDRH